MTEIKKCCLKRYKELTKKSWKKPLNFFVCTCDKFNFEEEIIELQKLKQNEEEEKQKEIFSNK